MAGGSERRPSKRDPHYEAYEASRALREKQREAWRRESEEYRTQRAAEYNEAGVTPRHSWTLFATRRTQELGFVASAAALVLALAGSHWLYAAVLSLNWIPARRFQGFVIVCLLINAATFAIGIALGLPLLATLGAFLPAAATLVLRLVAPTLLGLPRLSLVRDRDHGLDRAQRALGLMRYKLEQWQGRIRSSPSDRAVLEQVVFQMRDWDMTPSQAVRVASREGAPLELIEDIVHTKVRWPHLDQDDHIDAGWKWERIIPK